MTRADDPDDDEGGVLGYATREGPMPKLVVVAIVWAAFGIFGLFTAMLMHSSGFAVFGGLCIVAGVALYVVQRTRDQLAYDELHLDDTPWSPPSDEPVDVGDERPAADEDTTAYTRYDQHEDDILDAEFTEWFDYEPSPADQDDGTGYDDEEIAYQRFRADQWARDAAADDEDTEDTEDTGEDRAPGDAHDDESGDRDRTARAATGDEAARDGGPTGRAHEDHEPHEDHEAPQDREDRQAHEDHQDRESLDGRRR